MLIALHKDNSICEENFSSEQKTLYEHDFYAWTKEQSDILKSRRFAHLDILNLIEELESMGRSEKRELINRLTLLLGHLLKWVYQPERRSNSWLATIEEQRAEVLELIEDSPSLKYQLDQQFEKAYTKAVLFAVKETNLPKSTFAAQSPFSLEQILDRQYLPE
ncbi:MAG: DUF29 domain-containing protein [Desulfamplus sp.]|nr:DUF29 domain-containing protein [Desulfamplus sp.]